MMRSIKFVFALLITFLAIDALPADHGCPNTDILCNAHCKDNRYDGGECDDDKCSCFIITIAKTARNDTANISIIAQNPINSTTGANTKSNECQGFNCWYCDVCDLFCKEKGYDFGHCIDLTRTNIYCRCYKYWNPPTKDLKPTVTEVDNNANRNECEGDVCRHGAVCDLVCKADGYDGGYCIGLNKTHIDCRCNKYHIAISEEPSTEEPIADPPSKEPVIVSADNEATSNECQLFNCWYCDVCDLFCKKNEYDFGHCIGENNAHTFCRCYKYWTPPTKDLESAVTEVDNNATSSQCQGANCWYCDDGDLFCKKKGYDFGHCIGSNSTHAFRRCYKYWTSPTKDPETTSSNNVLPENTALNSENVGYATQNPESGGQTTPKLGEITTSGCDCRNYTCADNLRDTFKTHGCPDNDACWEKCSAKGYFGGECKSKSFCVCFKIPPRKLIELLRNG